MLRFLDPLLRSRDDLGRMRSFLEKTEKISAAVAKGANLGDIFSDPANLSSICKVVGDDDIESALTLITHIALQDYKTKSVTIRKKIEGLRQFGFLHRAVGGWKQFQTTVILRMPTGEDAHTILFNPLSEESWRGLETIPEGTQFTISLKTASGSRIATQENLALDRWEAVLDTVQDSGDQIDRVPVPALEVTAAPKAVTPQKPRAVAAVPQRKSFYANSAPNPFTKPSGPPVLSFKVVVNKMDTFVHAGNAHQIISHMRDYAGKVLLFVMRGEKKAVQLDADSIWGAEIRNGETVLFEFFGPQPSEDWVKELGKRVNKYTQMDKIANE